MDFATVRAFVLGRAKTDARDAWARHLANAAVLFGSASTDYVVNCAPRVPRSLRDRVFSWDLREKAKRRAGHRCEVCSTLLVACEVHHIVPRVHAGESSLDNAITLCLPCHLEAHFGLLTADALAAIRIRSGRELHSFKLRRNDLDELLGTRQTPMDWRRKYEVETAIARGAAEAEWLSSNERALIIAQALLTKAQILHGHGDDVAVASDSRGFSNGRRRLSYDLAGRARWAAARMEHPDADLAASAAHCQFIDLNSELQFGRAVQFAARRIVPRARREMNRKPLLYGRMLWEYDVTRGRVHPAALRMDKVRGVVRTIEAVGDTHAALDGNMRVAQGLVIAGRAEEALRLTEDLLIPAATDIRVVQCIIARIRAAAFATVGDAAWEHEIARATLIAGSAQDADQLEKARREARALSEFATRHLGRAT